MDCAIYEFKSVVFNILVFSQARSGRLRDFLQGDYGLLITTDLLSRGLDTKRVSLRNDKSSLPSIIFAFLGVKRHPSQNRVCLENIHKE